MDNLVSLLRAPGGVNADVKRKALGLIQSWSQVSEARPGHLMYAAEVCRTLKSDPAMRDDFPPLSAADPLLQSSAAFETRTKPEWIDGDVCLRCRAAFTTFNRKHHCRNCGNVFCGQCSSKAMALPWFGIGQDVRVCDGCFSRKAPPKAGGASDAGGAAKGSDGLSRSKSSTGSSSAAVKSGGRGGAGNAQRSSTLGSKPKSSRKEEEDLALAIKLSLESAGGSGPISQHASVTRPGYVPNLNSGGSGGSSAPSQPPQQRSSSVGAARSAGAAGAGARRGEGTDASTDDDPDLAAAIAASLAEYAPPQPSAPGGLSEEPEASGRRTPTMDGARGYTRYTSEAPSAASAPGYGYSSAPSAAGAAGAAKPALAALPSVDLAPKDIDSLLTFSQSLGAFDRALSTAQVPAGSAPPAAVQAAFEKASGARPRLVRGLGEAEKRQRQLQVMHEKLAEAVRMYDRLLDAQLAGNVGQWSGFGGASAGAAAGGREEAYRAPPQGQQAYGYQQQPQQHQAPYQQLQQQRVASQPYGYPASPGGSEAPQQQQQSYQQAPSLYPSIPSQPQGSYAPNSSAPLQPEHTGYSSANGSASAPNYAPPHPHQSQSAQQPLSPAASYSEQSGGYFGGASAPQHQQPQQPHQYHDAQQQQQQQYQPAQGFPPSAPGPMSPGAHEQQQQQPQAQAPYYQQSPQQPQQQQNYEYGSSTLSGAFGAEGSHQQHQQHQQQQPQQPQEPWRQPPVEQSLIDL